VITEICGPVTYRIWLPDRLSAVHDVFHVSQLRTCVHEPETETVEGANAWIEPDLSLVEHPMRVLDRKERKTRRQTVKMYKIQWSHHTEEEATWETKHFLNTKYPGFLQVRNRRNFTLPLFKFPNLRTRFLLRGVGCNILGVWAIVIITIRSTKHCLPWSNPHLWVNPSKP
jgi:hypothetical protein